MMNFNIQLPENVKKAIDMLYAGGFSAYAVGGCVRDSLMGLTPNDWDITTSAKPEEIKEIFAEYRTIDTGIKHGTVTVIMDKEPLEITAYRKEGVYSDHRHPDEVSFTTELQEDLKRRDFTVNAMAYNHIDGPVDIFGGREDIENRIIRCVGDAGRRFREDALRILRGLRFAATLGFDIEKGTGEAMDSLREDLKFVATERISEEFRKLICGKNAPDILRKYAHIFAEIIPELKDMYGCEQISRYHIYDVWEHTLKALEHAAKLTHDPEVRLAVLLHDIGKPRAKTYDEEKGVNHFYGHAPISADMSFDILTRLRFDSRTRDNVCWLIRHHSEKAPLKELRVKRLMASAGEELLTRLLSLMECDNSAKAPDVVGEREGITEQTLRLIEELKAQGACLSLKSLEIKGGDLLELGFPSGRILGETLNKLLDMVMVGNIKNEREALRAQAKRMLAMYPKD